MTLAAPPADTIPDPVPALQARRRRRSLVVAALVAAVAAAGAAALVAHELGARRHPVVLKEQPGNRGSSSPVLAVGAPVQAAQLFADPVFVDAFHGYSLARGTGGAPSERLVASSDGGATWRIVGATFPVAGTFTTLLFTDAEHGFVFGPAGLMVTTDGGRSWSQPPLTGEVQRVIPAYGDVWAVLTTCAGTPGQLLPCPVDVEISGDGGRSWRSTVSPPLTEGSAGGAVLGRVTADKAYLLTWGSAQSGLVETLDGGATWQHVPDPCGSGWSIEDMAALAAGRLWLVCGAVATAAGEVKAVYQSGDGGQTWTLEASTGFVPGAPAPVGSLTLSGDLSQLATVSPEQAWIGVGGVGVLVTSDGGHTWTAVPGVSDRRNAGGVGVTFIRSPDGALVDGWALGFGDAVWRTTDAVHWRRVAPAPA